MATLHLVLLALKGPTPSNDEHRVKLISSQSALDEVHRIIPLGLTLEEARAWYHNHVLLPRLRGALVPAIVGSAILLSMLSQAAERLDNTLATHLVVQHFLLVASGFLLTYASYSILQVASRSSNQIARLHGLVTKLELSANKLSLLTLSAAATLIAFWDLPAQFDAATVNSNVHLQMHLAFLFAGGLIFFGSHSMNKRLKLFAPVVVGKAMGLYGMFLLLTPINIYSAYPAYEQAYAGGALLFIMLGLDFTVLPLWLYSYFGKPLSAGGIRLRLTRLCNSSATRACIRLKAIRKLVFQLYLDF